LKADLPIPVFHDDQHGTAVVTLAALINACAVTGRRIEDVRALIVGVGAAGIAVAKILVAAGVRDVVGCDSRGALHRGREDYDTLSPTKRWLADETNHEGRTGGPAEVIEGMDLFVGLSGARVMPAAALAGMASDAMVFAMANPTPEVTPEEAAPYARVIATGRSDYPNQINNVLCFPGIFRGALDCGATTITEGMKLAAAEAIAASVPDDELGADYIVPSVFNKQVVEHVASAVAKAAAEEGVLRA
jgi:malate dehydrogenase (oxaloacetate-decarboxylating)